ncbi:MAG TPA: hypothetical protein PK691_07355, partial [Thermomicrobiales bacterium]|nr:hypothetical protein [Thermomicrobiales bacterium]
SPDSAWITFAVRDQRNVTDLWIVNRASGERTRLTKGKNASAPRFSSDGTYLAWLQMADYQFELWVANFVDGQIANNAKIYDENGIDPQSGLCWWIDPSTTISTDG